MTDEDDNVVDKWKSEIKPHKVKCQEGKNFRLSEIGIAKTLEN